MELIRSFLIAWMFALICSCKENKTIDSRRVTFFLQDSLLTISADVPLELDTFCTWIDHSDTNCATQRKYRFADSRYPIINESGFFYPTYPDSSYRLTFSHIDNYDCQELSRKIYLNDMADALEHKAKINQAYFKLFSSESIDINGQPFDILRFQTDLEPRQKFSSTLIWGFTRVGNIDLKIEYECATKNCDLFIEEMNKSLKSIRVTRND